MRGRKESGSEEDARGRRGEVVRRMEKKEREVVRRRIERKEGERMIQRKEGER